MPAGLAAAGGLTESSVDRNSEISKYFPPPNSDFRIESFNTLIINIYGFDATANFTLSRET